MNLPELVHAFDCHLTAKCVRKHDQPEVSKKGTFKESTLEIKMNTMRKM